MRFEAGVDDRGKIDILLVKLELAGLQFRQVQISFMRFKRCVPLSKMSEPAPR